MKKNELEDSSSKNAAFVYESNERCQCCKRRKVLADGGRNNYPHGAQRRAQARLRKVRQTFRI